MTILAALVLASCSQGKKSESGGHQHEGTEAEGHHDDAGTDGEAHEHGDAEEGGHEHGDAGEEGGHEHGGEEANSGESNVWTPSGDGVEAVQSDFHFIAGTIDNINPEIVEADGQSVLKLTADGTPAAFVFHKSYGNIGMAVRVNITEFKGTAKLVHHAENADNYEFVSINDGKMRLGRVVEGEEKIFDEADYSADDQWINLRASAAGTHYKGYIGNKMVTHGHGDEMKDGYVGIMLEGTGEVQVKSIETAILENE